MFRSLLFRGLRPRVLTKVGLGSALTYGYVSSHRNTLNYNNSQHDAVYIDAVKDALFVQLPVKPKISVIIPTLNEVNTIESTLRSLVRASQPSTRTKSNYDVEFIVADGGSTDGTIEKVRSFNIPYVSCRPEVLGYRPTRAEVMNEAVRQLATSDILLFVHSDTTLPFHYPSHVIDALRQAGTSGGAFRFHLDKQLPGSDLLEQATNLRSTTYQLPYGDQSIFLKRQTFEALNGYNPQLALMEDYDLVKRLGLVGHIDTVNENATTSSRRYEQLGVALNTFVNQLCIIGFNLGIPTNVLQKLYSSTYKLATGEFSRQMSG